MGDDGKEQILYHLNLQAQQLGVQYMGDDPQELAKTVSNIEHARRGKPPCFLRSFSPTDKNCRRCDEYGMCGDYTIFPIFTLEPMKIVECDMCDGDLHVVLFNDKGTIVDYGCSTPGCRNTLSLQQRRKK